ncbi:MAG: hypothetical protein B6D36_12095, partial [Planctomycetes bacterium UTPLA1]
AALAGAILGDEGPIDWDELQTHRTIREAIGKIVPGFERLSEIDETKREFQIAGRTFHQARFATASGRAKFHVTAMPDATGGDGQLRMMTVRSEGQFNTVVYEEEDIYRGQDRRDVVLMNPGDMERLGLRGDQLVTVRSETGEMAGVRARPFEIRAGNCLMYFPEANVLVPTRSDPRSKTPAFKSVMVRVEAAAGGLVLLGVERAVRKRAGSDLKAC